MESTIVGLSSVRHRGFWSGLGCREDHVETIREN